MPTQPEANVANRPDPRQRGVVFGGGAVGRGFIGEILLDAGWSVTFVDSSTELVAALSAGSYPHDTVSSSGVRRKILTGCSAVAAQDIGAVRREVVEADVVFTSVGARNLPRVATALAGGLADRYAAGRGPVDVFLAENLHDGATVMHRLLAEELCRQQTPAADTVLEGVGIVETSIGRMIPVPTAAQRVEHAALVAVEPFRQLPFDMAACRAPIPDIPELLGRDDVNFAFYSERKLYVHNFGHTLTAYLGALAGLQEIAPAVDNVAISAAVRDAMHLTARALAAKYEQPVHHLLEHADDLLQRFANTSLHDTVKRVGRDPERKLQPGDRFLGALVLAAEWGEPSAVIPGVALAAHQLALSRPAEDPSFVVAPAREEVARRVPGLVRRFDELLAALLDGAVLEEFLRLPLQ